MLLTQDPSLTPFLNEGYERSDNFPLLWSSIIFNYFLISAVTNGGSLPVIFVSPRAPPPICKTSKLDLRVCSVDSAPEPCKLQCSD